MTRTILRRLLPLIFLVLPSCGLTMPWESPETDAGAVPRAYSPIWDQIGLSVRGKPLLASTVGTGPLRIYIIGGVHGDEPEGPAVAAQLPDQILLGPVADEATFRVLRDMNPDGSAARTRTNTRGIDLNRNWPASNYQRVPAHGSGPLSELETSAVCADLESFKPDLVLVFHSSHRGPFVNFDGPAVGQAQRFAAAARLHDPRWRVVADMGYPTPGSLGTYLGVDRGVPILTVEFQRDRDADTNRRAAAAGLSAVAESARAASVGTPSRTIGAPAPHD